MKTYNLFASDDLSDLTASIAVTADMVHIKDGLLVFLSYGEEGNVLSEEVVAVYNSAKWDIIGVKTIAN